MRQGGDNAGSAAFRSALAELRNDTVGELTWRLLLSRCKQNLPANEVANFDNIIRLYGTRAAVGKYNYDRIRDLQRPILPIYAVNTSVGASKATLEQCDTVLKLYIC
jgi:hypothetical protein